MIVKFVFFQVRIIDVVFQVMLKTFLEKIYFLYNLVSCLGVFHSELRQTEFGSLVIVLVNVYCLCLVVLLSHQSFFRRFTGIYEFSSLVEWDVAIG